MTHQDPHERGDPASRPEGVFSHVLKALFGKAGPEPEVLERRHPEPEHDPAADRLARELDEASRLLRELDEASRGRPAAASEEPGYEPRRSEAALEAFGELHSLAGPPPTAHVGLDEEEPVFRLDLHELERAAEEPGEAARTGSGPAAETDRTGSRPATEPVAPAREPEPVRAEPIEIEREPEPVAASVAVGAPHEVVLPEAPEPRVLADLHHPSPQVRRDTLRGLQREPQRAPVVAVAARLQDPSPEVRESAIAVLDAMHDEAVLLLLLDAMQDPSEEVRRAARDAIRARRSPSLVGLLQRELSVPARRRAAARILADLGELDELLRAASGDDPDLRGLVREAMDDVGSTAQLIEDLTDGRPDRRRIAAERLGAMGVRDAGEALVGRLEDPDRGVRIKVAEALGRIGDQRAVHALKRAFIWDPDSGVVVAVGNALRKLAGTRAGRTITL